MLGDDEIQTETPRGFSLGESSHSGVDCDHEASAFCVSRFKHGGLQSVAFAETVGDMEADDSAKHLNGGLEKDDGCSAVDIVVAVEQNRLASGNGCFKTLDGRGH